MYNFSRTNDCYCHQGWRVFRSLSWLALVNILLATPPSFGQVTPTIELSLRVRLAICSGKPVLPSTWLEEQMAEANKLFQPHGIRLVAHQDSFTPASCYLFTKDDRDNLVSFGKGAEVTVLVIQQARDLDLPSYNLMGVHWRYKGTERAHRGSHWIILTARAKPPVLAHELSHYLGLPHDPAGGNLMTPGPSSPIWQKRGPKPKEFAPVLTADQGKKLRARLEKLIKRKLISGQMIR